MPDIAAIIIFLLSFVTGVVFGWLIRHRAKTSVVDEYTLSLGPSQEFPTVHLRLKLDTGDVVGPYEFVPAFAYQLSDQLCVASARATKRVTAGESSRENDAKAN